MGTKLKDTLIVNIFGGPGAGKSTTRAALFAKLKLAGYNCEEAVEWCKAKVYERNPYVFTDQLYIFAKQRKSLMQVINDVDVIVTDSPIILSALYDCDHDPIHRTLFMYEFSRFNNLNILLNRVKPYSTIGRFQDEDGAHKVDTEVRALLDSEALKYHVVNGDEQAPEVILKLIQDIQLNACS